MTQNRCKINRNSSLLCFSSIVAPKTRSNNCDFRPQRRYIYENYWNKQKFDPTYCYELKEWAPERRIYYRGCIELVGKVSGFNSDSLILDEFFSINSHIELCYSFWNKWIIKSNRHEIEMVWDVVVDWLVFIIFSIRAVCELIIKDFRLQHFISIQIAMARYP